MWIFVNVRSLGNQSVVDASNPNIPFNYYITTDSMPMTCQKFVLGYLFDKKVIWGEKEFLCRYCRDLKKIITKPISY